jgi:hypothetical protein
MIQAALRKGVMLYCINIVVQGVIVIIQRVTHMIHSVNGKECRALEYISRGAEVSFFGFKQYNPILVFTFIYKNQVEYQLYL